MEFQNRFEVDVPPSEAWVILNDVTRIAPCMPGAELTEIVDENSFKGNVSVRLGPVALTFTGSARFEERDRDGLAARVTAQGRDAKGRGGANADVRFRLLPSGEDGTAVEIDTNLQLSGAVAQYGRGIGMIKDVAGQLIGQFADALQRQIAAERTATPTAEESAADPPPAAKPISGLGLGARALWNALLRLVGLRTGG